jgi:phage terminase large subunit-like protein
VRARVCTAGRKCYGGLDLASVRDLTHSYWCFRRRMAKTEVAGAVVGLVPGGEARIEADDAAPYKTLAAEGWLTVTDGDVTDYDPVRETVLVACQTFDVDSIGFDIWNAQQLCNELLAEDVPLVEIPQNTGGMYPGAKKLEELVYSKRLRHGGNPVLRWCAGNVALLYDTNGNFRPDKKRSKKNGRIDPIVATVMALSRAVGVEPEEQEPGILLL